MPGYHPGMFGALPNPDYRSCTVDLAGGMAGIRQTLRAMRRYVNDWRKNPIVRDCAMNVVFMCPQKDYEAEARAIFDYVRDSIRYTRDIHEVETLQTPEVTLHARGGDCDDQTTLLCSLFESVGFPTRFVVAGYAGADVTHVYCEVEIEGEWVRCDPTMPEPMGYEPPGATCLYIEAR